MTFPKPSPPYLVVFAVALLAASCGSDAPKEAAEETETSAAASGKFEHATWQLQAGEDAFEGNMAFVARSGGKIHLQFVNADAVNLAMLFPEEGAGARAVEHSYFAVERGQRCQLVASDPPYQVTLDSGDGVPLKGSFTGMLGCADYSAVPVKGSFEVLGAGD